MPNLIVGKSGRTEYESIDMIQDSTDGCRLKTNALLRIDYG